MALTWKAFKICERLGKIALESSVWRFGRTLDVTLADARYTSIQGLPGHTEAVGPSGVLVHVHYVYTGDPRGPPVIPGVLAEHTGLGPILALAVCRLCLGTKPASAHSSKVPKLATEVAASASSGSQNVPSLVLSLPSSSLATPASAYRAFRGVGRG